VWELERGKVLPQNQSLTSTEERRLNLFVFEKRFGILA